MKVLLNTTPLVIGGGLQLATSLARGALANPHGIEWHFALSRKTADEIARFLPDLPRATVFDRSPATKAPERRRLLELEAAIQPDCVFTPYGPAYVKFAAPHLCGAANPWVTHADLSAYRTRRFPDEWFGVFLLAVYRGYWYRQAEQLVVETASVRQGLHRRTGVPLERISVVHNTCGVHYLENSGRQPRPQPGERVRILCFAAPYKHKRLTSVPRVARELIRLRPELDFEFVMTMSEDEVVCQHVLAAIRKYDVGHCVTNLGVVPIAEGPALYRSCHICFMPTVLECFSATYPEAMAMGLPIVTSDLGFLRDICGDAALYFPPFRPRAAAETILRLLDDDSLWNALIDRGKSELAKLPTAERKYAQYVELLWELHRRSATATRRA